MTWKSVVAGLSLAIIGVACDGLRPVCGCTPAELRANVTGKIFDAAAAPVANVPFYMVGVGTGVTFDPPEAPEMWMPKTSAVGDFNTQVMGMGLPGSLELHVAVYPPGRSRVVVTAGMVPFSYDPQGQSTVTVVLPP